MSLTAVLSAPTAVPVAHFAPLAPAAAAATTVTECLLLGGRRLSHGRSDANQLQSLGEGALQIVQIAGKVPRFVGGVVRGARRVHLVVAVIVGQLALALLPRAGGAGPGFAAGFSLACAAWLRRR